MVVFYFPNIMKRAKLLNLGLELLVVIFGVTIAFSLESWREGRKETKLEIEYLKSFKNDLEKDTLELRTYIDTLSVHKSNTGKLIGVIFQRDLENDSLLDYSLSLFFMTSFVPHSATYQSLTSSGQLQTIRNFELRKSIVDLYDINYAEIALLDEFNKNQVFDYKTPFLHDNMVYTQGGILNKEIILTPKYMNMTMSTFYFFEKKIQEYEQTLENCGILISKLDENIKALE